MINENFRNRDNFICHVPGIILGTSDNAISRRQPVFVLTELAVQQGKQKTITSDNLEQQEKRHKISRGRGINYSKNFRKNNTSPRRPEAKAEKQPAEPGICFAFFCKKSEVTNMEDSFVIRLSLVTPLLIQLVQWAPHLMTMTIVHLGLG